MKKVLLLLLPFIAILSLSGCSSTQSYLGGFSNFVDRTDAQCQDYSVKDWKRNVTKFKDYSITRFRREKGNLSSAQLKEIVKLNARYMAIVSSQGVVTVTDIMKDAKTLGPDVIGTFIDQFLQRTEK